MQKLVEQATEERNKRTKPSEKFDVIAAIEFGFFWSGKKFVFGIFSEEDWRGDSKEDAFIKFSPDPSLSIREAVYSAAESGDKLSRFTLAHEIAHALLHRRLARIIHVADGFAVSRA
jgi:23S rRNA pseudoU1915 N3-methylase RlmH